MKSVSEMKFGTGLLVSVGLAVQISSLSACGRHTSPVPVAAPAVSLAQRTSAYAGSPADWAGFLQCWQRANLASAANSGSILGEVTIQASPGDGAAAKALAQRLGIRLPQSYSDFLAVYRMQLKGPQPVGGHFPTGLYAPEDVRWLKDLDPELIRIYQQVAAQNGGDVADADYYRYGVDQDSVSGRAAYLDRAIVLGKHGRDSEEYILMYPDSQTKDGEYEVALIWHAGEFRAPSFAEVMRQLYFMDTQNPDSVAPYAQTRLRGTCADAMPLREVWWR